MKRTASLYLLSGALLLFSLAANAQGPDAQKQLARDVFKQLIEINTTDTTGNVTTSALAMAKRLREAGFAEADIHVDGPTEKKKNVVVRLHGSGRRKPILLLGHLDVVEALRRDWTTDPFQFVETEGYFYGRGVEDMKGGDAILVANFIRMKNEKFAPDRDLILALTADEEGGSYDGVDWLLKAHRDWIDAEYCINLDGGDFEKDKGRRLLARIQASEKVYVDYQFESLNPGGHSSRPSPDNAIYHVAGALTRLRDFSFPLRLSEITRNYFARTAALKTGQIAADMKGVAQQPPDPVALAHLSAIPGYNTLLRTTCVATMLSGGHAPNALPQTARANVNCRIFPGEEPEEVRRTLERIADDPQVKVTIVPQLDPNGKEIPAVAVPPSPLLPEVMKAMETILNDTWPGISLIPSMEAGATDGRYTRVAGIPTFGISCRFLELSDNRAHGKDERIGVQDFYEGVDFCHKLIKELSSPH
jgi:acetylornithine deacetylase/succinyl-diaminopimelate desuccinylase-like protein